MMHTELIVKSIQKEITELVEILAQRASRSSLAEQHDQILAKLDQLIELVSKK